MQIANIFESIQAEGIRTGWPSVFLRLAGCNFNCDWCDTDHKFTLESTKEVIDDLLSRVTRIPHLVITGGEPLIQLEEVHSLISTVYKNCERALVNLQTNGFASKNSVNELTSFYLSTSKKLFLSVAPKWPELIDSKKYRDHLTATKNTKEKEIKLIGGWWREDKKIEWILKHMYNQRDTIVFQPMWIDCPTRTKDANIKDNAKTSSDFIRETSKFIEKWQSEGIKIIFSVQIHKFLGVE